MGVSHSVHIAPCRLLPSWFSSFLFVKNLFTSALNAQFGAVDDRWGAGERLDAIEIVDEDTTNDVCLQI